MQVDADWKLSQFYFHFIESLFTLFYLKFLSWFTYILKCEQLSLFCRIIFLEQTIRWFLKTETKKPTLNLAISYHNIFIDFDSYLALDTSGLELIKDKLSKW